jgi:hypothetical protein
LRPLRTLALGTALLVGASAGLACASDDEGTAAPTLQVTTVPDTTIEQTTIEATTEVTTTEEGPPPIRAFERRWVREMNDIRRRMTRGFNQTRVYTNAVMTRLARTYSTCLSSLRRAGRPGRFRSAARIAERACTRVERAGQMMAAAVAIDSAGITSQAQADRYNLLVDRAFEAQGNAVNDFAQASARARTIELELAG